MKKSRLSFTDTVFFDSDTKTGKTVRDGVLIYKGIEIGKQPYDKDFTVYRSPATIASLAAKLPGIPIIEGHIDPEGAPPTSDSKILASNIVDSFDEAVSSTLAIDNQMEIDAKVRELIDSGKKELSLGYTGDLVDSSNKKYDFEQVNLVPHHLAVVEKGRCGSVCSFRDSAGGAFNLSEVVDLAVNVPDIIKSLSVDNLSEAVPLLKRILELSKMSSEDSPKQTDGETKMDKEALKDLSQDEIMALALEALAAKNKTPLTDEEKEKLTDEEKQKLADEEAAEEEKQKLADEEAAEKQKLADEEAEEKKGESFQDSTKFRDAVAGILATHGAVIDKAKNFLPKEYLFGGKTSSQVMRDAVQHNNKGVKFTDSEIPVAFKMLKKQGTDMSNFGQQFKDEAGSSFDALANKSF